MAHAMKRSAAIALAAGLALPGAIGTSVVLSTSPAYAQAGIGTETGSLTIHKKLNPAGEPGTGTGAEDPNVTGSDLGGVQFTVQKLNFDLADAAQFAEAAALAQELNATNAAVETDAQAIQDRYDGEPLEATTGADGSAVLPNLEVGAYLVTEQPTANPEVIPAAPFIVFMPMTGTNGTWNRDVHVYPKNSSTTTTKTVVDADKHPGNTDGQGDLLTYTINVTVPQLPQNRQFTEFNVVDYYNNQELLDVEVTQVTVGGAARGYTGGTPEAPGANETTPDDSNQKINVTLNNPETLTAGQQVAVTVTGRVAQIDANQLEDGKVVNTARTTGSTQVTGRPGWDDKTFQTPDDEVTSYFGAVQVIKTGEGDARLEGAVFDLYKVPSQAEGACNDRSNQQIVRTGIITDGNGTAVINGLHVTDIQNNDEQITDTYCLLETNAPSGYLESDTPIPFTLTRGDAQTGDVATVGTVRIAKEVTVPNERIGVILPGTGGMGVLAIIALGLVIIGGGAYAARRNSAAA